MLRHKMIYKFCFILIFALFVLSCHVRGYEENYDCPRKCSCLGMIVNCANKQLSFFPSDIPRWCGVLLLADNKLETLTAEARPLILSPTNLTHIDLTRTQLHQFDSDFFLHLFTDIAYIDYSLQTLKLDENNLQIFPLINGLSNLRTLSIANNILQSDAIYDIDLQIYPVLESLDLSNNLIKHIPKHFLANQLAKPNVKLVSLNLQNNGIDVIDKEAFELFVNLKVLRLSKNNIAVISKEMFGTLLHLKELDLNFNQIERIDSLAFNNLDSLQILRMRRNRLNHLSDGSFWGLPNLQKLHLDHNNITNIHFGWTYGLKSLAELTIRHNAINDIKADAWNSASNLVELHLNHNQLQKINKEAFNKLTSLQVLKLSNNYISIIDEEAFAMLSALEILDLSSNELSWTIESSNGFFTTLESLKKLRLDNNQIKLIFKHTFSGLTNLALLNVTGNPISSIQSDSFQWFQNLKELHLEETDLLCDCSLKWFVEWLKSTELRRKFAKKIRCRHPQELYLRTARSFLNADINDFKCQDFLKPYLMDDFSSIDKPISAIKSKNITFYCKVATGSQDKVQFKWLKDNQIVSHNRAKFETLASLATENVTHYTNVLTVANVQDDDEGKYHCMASNNFGTVYSHKFKVNVYVVPHFIKEPVNITVKVGHTARLECAAKGQPSPIISWQKDGGDSFPAAMERRMHVMPADDVFFIVEVKKSDMGAYTCNATNDAGSVITTAFLNVYEPPSFVRKMNDKKALVGSTVSLECMAAGIPMPKVSWSKDGVLLEPTERHFFTAEGQLLIIVKLKHSDSGKYSCNISNDYGNIEDSSELAIYQYLSSDKPSASDLSFASIYKKNGHDDMMSSFFSFIRTHGIILIIIILCVVFTSIIWILVICYIRRRHTKPYAENDVKDIENDDEDNQFDGNHFDLSRNDKFLTRVVPYYHTDIDFDGLNSESSSGQDTGIEGSCKSNEDDPDPIYSFDPSYSYLHQSNYICQSLQRHHPKVVAVPVKESKLVYTTLPKNFKRDPQYDDNRNDSFNNVALSSKKKKLLLKKNKHLQMMSSRKQIYNSQEFLEQAEQLQHHYQSDPKHAQIKRTFSSKSFSVDNVSEY